MIGFIKNFFESLGLTEIYVSLLSYSVYIFFLIFICLLSQKISNYLLKKTIGKFVKKTKIKWDEIIFNDIFLKRISFLLPAIIIYSFSTGFEDPLKEIIMRISSSLLIFIFLLLIDSALNSSAELYNLYSTSKTTPIKGYIQIFKLFVNILGSIAIIGTLMDKPFGIFLSAIGAMTAVLLVIFKDTLLGFVASIQITTNDLVKIGDWIEMPKYGADGDVIDINLHTVKVKNWDMTITVLPTYSLISESFKNWRGMVSSKGRRISRSIFIDMNSIKFCDEEMLKKFEKIEILKDYLDIKKNEINNFNKRKKIDESYIVNARNLTNIGTFRAYCKSYLENHPKIDKTKIILVRQLEPSEKGLPLQIYAFTNDIAWKNYEEIQGDIFDHFFSIIEYFDLRIFQAVSGYDISKLK